MDTMNTSNTMHDEDHYFSSPSDYHSTVDAEIDADQSILSSGESETFVEIHNASSPDMLDETSVVTDNVDQNKVRRKCIHFSFLRSLFSDSSPSITRIRLHQVWPGNNVFFFRGRVICGPDPRGFLLTMVSIILSNWIFCVYIGEDLSKNRTVVVTSSLVLSIIVIVNLILVGTRDPGIVPRNMKPVLSGGTSFRTRSLRISVDGVEMKLKYCRVCMIYRPPRTCHCAVCDNCVERFDHHCPWIGQCIGLRNYRYYLMFIVSAMVFFIYVFIFSCWRIRRRMTKAGSGMFKALGNVPETLALALFSFVAMWFLGGLVVFHVYLTALNQTARENFKRQYTRTPNPFDKGVFRNIKEVLFKRLGPSRVNFRAVVEPEYGCIARMFVNSKQSDKEVEIEIE